LENSWNVDVYNGIIWPIWALKIWPKERPKGKLPIWLLITKSQKSHWFTCMQLVCHIPLESFQQGLQLFFRPHFNRRSTQDIMAPFKVVGISGQNGIWMQALWPNIENIIRKKVVASPKFGPWWVLWVCVCPWFIYEPKVLKLCSNQLVVWFVQVRVSNWLACHL